MKTDMQSASTMWNSSGNYGRRSRVQRYIDCGHLQLWRGAIGAGDLPWGGGVALIITRHKHVTQRSVIYRRNERRRGGRREGVYIPLTASSTLYIENIPKLWVQIDGQVRIDVLFSPKMIKRDTPHSIAKDTTAL